MMQRDTDFKMDDPPVVQAQNFYSMSLFALSDTTEMVQQWRDKRITALRYWLTSYKRNKSKWNKTYPIPFQAIFPQTDSKLMTLSEKLKEYDEKGSERVETIDLL